MQRYLLNLILFLLPSTRLFPLKRLLASSLGVDVAHGASLAGSTCFFGSGKVRIGVNTWIGMQGKFYTARLADVIIGANCDIAPNVSFVSGSHIIGTSLRRAGAGTADDVIINDGCWIGTGSCILPGVTVGKGSIIWACSLVDEDVQANCIYGGVPARLIRRLSEDE